MACSRNVKINNKCKVTPKKRHVDAGDEVCWSNTGKDDVTLEFNVKAGFFTDNRKTLVVKADEDPVCLTIAKDPSATSNVFKVVGCASSLVVGDDPEIIVDDEK